MAMTVGVSRMRFHPAALSASGPLGRQLYKGRPLWYSRWRCRTRSLTHGCALAGSASVSGTGPFHIPVRSGWPPVPRGAGAVRFGLPSDLRGMFGVGRSSHWAAAGNVPTTSASSVNNRVITSLHACIGNRTGDLDLGDGFCDTLFIDIEL